MKKPGLFGAWILGLSSIAALSCGTGDRAFAAGIDTSWRIRQARWSEADERRFSDFVRALGESRCRTTDDCLKNPANPYRSSDPAGIQWLADCADFPFVMRAYFAWKNGLPFSFASQVASVGGGTDIRYTPKGNKVTARVDITARESGQFPNAVKVLRSIRDSISSAMFRFDPKRDDGVLFTDHYPVKVSKETIRPGTVIYDPNGHVAMVYKVEADGRVLFMDAHPDNSITRGTYGKKFARANPGMGAGFKNWRPIQLTGFQKDASGNLLGGKVVASRNAQLADYSTEQFFGTKPSGDGSWKAGTFVIENEAVDYYDYVRRALAVGNLKYNPVGELSNMLDALCQDVKDRVTAVQLAIDHGIPQKAEPSKLPNNIYGTSGEWEEYATPSRDARLKTSFKEVRDRAEEFVELSRGGSPRLEYSGTDIKKDLLTAYLEKTRACTIEYRKSDGSTKTLSLDDVADRLFSLSFDPYHCVERRWGATSSDELSTCPDDALKTRWYEGEQFLRNQIDRTYDARTDFTLEQLFIPQKGNGAEKAPDVDLEAYLRG